MDQYEQINTQGTGECLSIAFDHSTGAFQSVKEGNARFQEHLAYWLLPSPVSTAWRPHTSGFSNLIHLIDSPCDDSASIRKRLATSQLADIASPFQSQDRTSILIGPGE